ncbi:hypothetical protein G3I59_36095 [Amycolatopsis rubida]|uniref:Uncharacterized protein n=1 Tax=Amycolatopsis rubida TaxID=112413 RepID=A0A1I5QSQ5_9PSEU|nr:MULTISPECIES: hypothetical protein [Amycolatopsis]MYW94894.1 hypothetical protein [Amycolatopsis rubida]MYW95886.1 hypothetical protein [Amycolatopsis rubida]NEC59881.1 hypothetical protein [Amycolatopsis rubida]NEC60876.1 hypothetical protein [Amycolatopsis rubida]OAP26654.1 hypothetical protein A4R44_02641 [Amycolatopsis sp. M39]
MIELIGVLLVVQGAGGLINRIAGSRHPSWFLQLQVLPPQLHVIASIVLLGAGVAVLFANRARNRRRG